MAYITENFLRSKAVDVLLESRAKTMMQKTASLLSAKKIFLSHSHHDKELAKGLKNYLSSLGINLYIDWLDSSMPPKTNKETADKIKGKIGNSDHVLILATNNAVNSRWVPWEIGVADIKKTPSGVSILPVVDSSGKFEGNEYLQLYNRVIVADDGRIAVFEPNKTSGGMVIDSWLRRI